MNLAYASGAIGGEKIMAEKPTAELLRSLARLVRGLSAVFWGLPLMLLVYVQTAQTDWLQVPTMEWMAMVPSLLVTGLIYFGLSQMYSFQAQERVWIRSLDRAQLLVFINFGLAPFLYWWHRMPHVKLYAAAVGMLALSSVFFLYNLNHVLQRLSAMLPDETVRLETKMFTSLNRSLLLSIPIVVTTYLMLANFKTLPGSVIALLAAVAPFGLWLLLFLVLMPLAMTMALIWKIKEVIFHSVFEANASNHS